jgi:hypothetical protein
MLKETLQKFPKWVNEINKEDYNLILSDDLDSLFSCALLKHYFGCEVRGFVDWNSGVNGKQQSLYTNKSISKKKYVIGVDMAIENGKCFDNHVVMLNSNDTVNEDSANLNAINKIGVNNYYSKFCSSSLIQILSLYNADINSFDDEQKLVICAIDGLYVPYKIQKIDFSKTQREYMKQLEYEELSDFMKYHCDKTGYSEFERVKKQYNLDGKIWVNDSGKLETNIDLQGLSELFGGFDLSLPRGEFKEFKRFDKQVLKVNSCSSKDSIADCSSIFNFVVVKKDMAIYSLVKR